ncbi:Uncharacterised protein [Yokenella regensburgei]|uniref:Uncharacterized protein n=1 Tax=Yokenella regensburgei TaxID=158877 RepID=A0AB38FX27_9ENTR|nr:Uncharacterised protein [Yokenella regensburgei]SQA68736.1 Uncharacterised protein [Yokenella regensburgei]SUQ07051.1 Uncharacterised protein [Yokenella regensburgei]
MTGAFSLTGIEVPGDGSSGERRAKQIYFLTKM